MGKESKKRCTVNKFTGGKPKRRKMRQKETETAHHNEDPDVPTTRLHGDLGTNHQVSSKKMRKRIGPRTLP